MRGLIRQIFEILVSTILLIYFQYIPLVGGFHMLVPLMFYIISLEWAYPDLLGAQIYLLLFSEGLLFGRMVVVIGCVIFLIACGQYLQKKGKVISTGFYSLVRHPQYLGISVVTLGLTLMCKQYRYHTVSNEALRFAWLIQTVGYILLAVFEEHYLLKEHQEKYRQYRQKVPFIFPIPYLPNILEPLISMMAFITISFLLV
jgi:protein-S-isoprenylcysteine O-methyltransferase Ste14